VAFKLYKFFTLGIWIKSISTCQVFSILCFDNLIFAWISNIEAFLFVPLFFVSYYFLHKFLIRNN
jgi:hypothetical protein